MIGVDRDLAGRVSGKKHRAIVVVAVPSALVGVVVLLLALVIAPPAVAVIAGVVVAGAVGVSAWWGSVPVALHVLGAQAADPVRHARLFNLVEGLGANAGVAQPELYVVDDTGLNALTMGRSSRHAAVVVTSALVEHLTRMELEAVLAHELSHIRSDDMLTATLAVPLFGILGGAARAATGAGAAAVAGYVLLPISALAGAGLRFATDPRREEMADTAGVHLTRYPPALVSALEKMQRGGTIVHGGAGSPALAHLWLGAAISAPPSPRLAWLTRLYDTHPPMDERIEALREL